MTPGPLRWLLMATHVPAGGAGGGMVRYTVEVAAALHRRDDVSLSVAASADAVPYFTDLLGDPARVHAVPTLPTVARSVLERHTRLVERGGPHDVVHGTKHLLPRATSALRLLTVHDMVMVDRPQDFGLLKRRLLTGPYLASVRGAHVLVCVSAATRARLLEEVPGVGGRARVVPLAVSSDLLRARPRAVPALAGRRFAVVVGDASLRKNLGLLVDCWDEVRARVPDAVLAVAGPPSWAASDHGEAFERLAAAGAVLPLGRVPDEELRWCYEHAAVALCPSLLEGFGLPAVEALAFGAPLVTSTDPALVEASGDAALHLPPDDPRAWVVAVSAALERGRPASPPPRPVRTWDEVAAGTVAAARTGLGLPG